MKIEPLFHKLKTILVGSILVASFLFSSTKNASAVVDVVRDAKIDSNGRCETEKIKFDPLGPNDDLLWELDNGVCIAYGASVGVVLIGTEMAANYMCNSTDPAKALKASKETAELVAAKSAGLWVTLKTLKRTVSGWASCSAYTSECGISGGTSVFRCGQAAACCSSMASKMVSFGIAMAELGVIYQAAVDSQKNAHLCGETWNTWEKRQAKQRDESDGEGISDYQDGSLPNNEFYVYGKKQHSYQLSLENSTIPAPQFKDHPIRDKKYREYIYGGQEYEDNDGSYTVGADEGADVASMGSGGCALPKWPKEKLMAILGYDSGKQRYYMRGPKVASNYACSRYLLYKGTPDERKSARAAYECCKKRSQETICIEEDNALANAVDQVASVSGINSATSAITDGIGLKTKYKFCKLGERCKVQNVWYEIHPAKELPNYICATTYSVCPYNHNLGGGTEIAQYATKHQNILTNHCQYLKHCTKKPDVPYIRTSDLDGGWISSACFDMKGDSQNNYGFTAQLVPINTKNFSAPIAQCFKETLENIFINKAGHTQCKSPDEVPDKNGNCNSGYLFKEGKVITGQKSFFQTIQDKLQTAIKVVMTMAVTIMGIGVLLTGSPWDKKTLIMFVVKLGLVSYFALGTAWQDTFFNGVSSASMSLANIFMRVDQGDSSEYKDGCQFPKYNSQTMSETGVMETANPSYPAGKEYLAIWDMLDCKIARALGFGIEASVPNLIFMILAGFLTGGMGIIFFAASFIFGFYLVALTVRALHIFLISSMAITIMIYVSPITITASLFKRTEGIFKSWRTQLIGFVLQPVIVFCYLGILITIFEKTIIGDATFSGNGIDSPKEIICSTGNAQNNSIYCIFKVKDLKTMNALAPLGIGLPVLFNMNQEKLATITKGAFLMFIFTKFLDQITGLSARLVGGSALKSDSKGALAALGKGFGMAKAVQSRGKNATQKWGGALASGAKNAVGALGSRAAGGKRADGPGGNAGTNDTAGGGANSAAASKPASAPTGSGSSAPKPTGPSRVNPNS